MSCGDHLPSSTQKYRKIPSFIQVDPVDPTVLPWPRHAPVPVTGLLCGILFAAEDPYRSLGPGDADWVIRRELGHWLLINVVSNPSCNRSPRSVQSSVFLPLVMLKPERVGDLLQGFGNRRVSGSPKLQFVADPTNPWIHGSLRASLKHQISHSCHWYYSPHHWYLYPHAWSSVGSVGSRRPTGDNSFWGWRQPGFRVVVTCCDICMFGKAMWHLNGILTIMTLWYTMIHRARELYTHTKTSKTHPQDLHSICGLNCWPDPRSV